MHRLSLAQHCHNCHKQLVGIISTFRVQYKTRFQLMSELCVVFGSAQLRLVVCYSATPVQCGVGMGILQS